ASPTATATAETIAACIGDCDDSTSVTVDEIVLGVSIALGNESTARCLPMDADGDGEITVDELLRSLNSALSGCPAVG
ncbi:MAG TPA: hypothetical protein VEB21_16635, partial [Terriglobales bacterium]|nr:hypothetical protein [Terriglobales bacterium]